MTIVVSKQKNNLKKKKAIDVKEAMANVMSKAEMKEGLDLAQEMVNKDSILAPLDDYLEKKTGFKRE